MSDLKRACMHATYTKANDGSNSDMVVVKEQVHEVIDGVLTVKPNLRIIKDYERPYWITKKAHQSTHKFKKEYEVLENLDMHMTTMARAPFRVARALGVRNPRPWLGELKESPYLYGLDVPVESLIKKEYADRYPGLSPDATVAALDYETNVFSEAGEIISGSLTMKDKAILAVSREFLGTTPDVDNRITAAFHKYLGEYVKSRNLKLYVKICDNDLGVVRCLMGSAHKLKPDIISIWNMAFDVNKMLETLNRHGVDPKDIFSDPSIPPEYRSFKWLEDREQKETATGKVTSKHFADLWHSVIAPASFYIIDSMCFFKRNRVREANRHSYKLDAILSEELNLGKLRFEEADGHGDGLEWHKYMQTHHKIEYLIYNIFDCVALELLDEKTRDLSRALPAAAGLIPYSKLSSGPTNLAINLHFFLMEEGKVICTCGPSMREEFDSALINMNGHIVTLANELVARQGTPVVSDSEDLYSRIYTQLFDIDIASGYPTTGYIMNVSKETTLREVCAIEGYNEQELRRIAVDLTGLRVNAVNLGKTLYQLPDLNEALDLYERVWE